MARQLLEIDSSSPDSIQTNPYPSRIEADFANDTRLGDHLDEGLGGFLIEAEDDEVLRLFVLPVPVLGEVGGAAGFEGEGGAAVGVEEAVGELGADVQGEEGEERDAGAVGEA